MIKCIEHSNAFAKIFEVTTPQDEVFAHRDAKRQKNKHYKSNNGPDHHSRPAVRL
jgi:hypothetical protein